MSPDTHKHTLNPLKAQGPSKPFLSLLRSWSGLALQEYSFSDWEEGRCSLHKDRQTFNSPRQTPRKGLDPVYQTRELRLGEVWVHCYTVYLMKPGACQGKRHQLAG